MFVEGGANDFRWNATLGTISDLLAAIETERTGGAAVGLGTFYRAVYTTLVSIQNQDWTRLVYVVGMFPNTRADIFGSEMPNYQKPNANGNYYWEFVEAIRQVCDLLGVHYRPFAGIGGPSSAVFLIDGVHFSSSGGYRAALEINADLITLRPVVQNWNLRTAVLGDFTSDRLTLTSIDGDGIVQYSGQPTTGRLWAAIWLTDGSTNNACEFEIAEPSKGLWVTFGRGNNSPTSWVGKGDPRFDVGQFNYIATFSSDAEAFPAVTNPVTNNIGVYATKYRLARLGNYVTCQAEVGGSWLQAFNIDIDQQTRPAITSTLFPQARCGILVADASYTKVKNVRVGTLELR